MEIENIVKKIYMFKVCVKSFNYDNQDEVFAVVMLADNEDIINNYIPFSRAETFKIYFSTELFLNFSIYD